MANTHQVGDGQIKELLATVEQLRKTKYPDVPAAVVREMLVRHQDAAATETELDTARTALAGAPA